MSLESWFAQGVAELTARWQNTSTEEIIWLTVGFAAQGMFMMRFVIQWIASEKTRRSVIPEAFWYWSLTGGFMMFLYAIYRLDPVFMLGQGSGLFIYARNIYFIHKAKHETVAIVQNGYKPAAE